ncbi:type IV pilin-like G/H family protein [Rivularia sp. PCC 7116]|uniref:type IV pilin-like G/H family protein n=1 Tax=Rivularia sp. PCC 7116 TaxID=373994 RepID=UPI0012FC8A8A|nr:type IV pilin-like G/H family protein [Rivularia sp. PCC 7116]
MAYAYIESNVLTSCACKSKSSEGKVYTGVMNRAQQALYLEKNFFAKSFNELSQIQNLGFTRETKYYRYSVQAPESAVFHYAVPRRKILEKQESLKIKSYVGAVFIISDPEHKSKTQTKAIICQFDTSGAILPQPTLENNLPICPKGTSSL